MHLDKLIPHSRDFKGQRIWLLMSNQVWRMHHWLIWTQRRWISISFACLCVCERTGESCRRLWTTLIWKCSRKLYRDAVTYISNSVCLTTLNPIHIPEIWLSLCIQYIRNKTAWMFWLPWSFYLPLYHEEYKPERFGKLSEKESLPA